MPPRATGKRGKQPPPPEESDGSEEEALELVPNGEALQLDNDSDEDAFVTSGSEEDGDEEAASDEDEEGDGEVQEAVLDYMAAAERARREEDLAAARREGAENEDEDEEEMWVHAASMCLCMESCDASTTVFRTAHHYLSFQQLTQNPKCQSYLALNKPCPGSDTGFACMLEAHFDLLLTNRRPVDPGSDSSEDEREPRNTIGDVPLEWYKVRHLIVRRFGFSQPIDPLRRVEAAVCTRSWHRMHGRDISWHMTVSQGKG